MGRGGWLLVLLLLPAVVAPGARGEVASVELVRVPTWASRDGAAYVVEVEVAGPAGVPFELRAELGDGERQASRFWNGTGWQTSQRYAPFGTFDGEGRWRGFVRIAANAEGANFEDVTGAADGVARVRIRIRGEAFPWAAAQARWFGGGAGPAAGWVAGLAGPGDVVELRDSGVAAVALADAAGSFRLAAPAGSYFLGAERVLLEPGTTRWFGPEPPGRFVIDAFAFHAYESPRDDFVEICNIGDKAASLDGVALRDGEGELALPPLLVPAGACATVAGDADAFARYGRRAPETSWGPGGAVGVIEEGFALSYEDELELLRYGRVVDSVAWGDGRSPVGWEGPAIRASDALGRIYRRHGPDTDTADDWWSPRPLRVGQSDFAPFATRAANVTAFLAPDSSFATLARLIDNARSDIAIEVYEFTHQPLAARLERALRNGNVTSLRLVVEDAPAGRTPESRDRAATLLARLQAAGADVRVVSEDRYTFHHAKVAVVDGRWSLVASENMNPSGFPPSGSYGNRGWGVVVDSPELAGALLKVLDWDADENWTTPFVLDEFAPDRRAPLFANPVGPYRSRFAPFVAGPARVSLLVSPEQTVPPKLLLDEIRNATHEVLVEFLTLAPLWRTERGDEPNPLVEALLEAARRGVRVRVLLAGDFVDPTDGAPDNLDTARLLLERSRGLDLQVRLADPIEIGTIHNKGLVVDRRVVHVGSLNGNLHSASRNREIGLVVESEAAATHFAGAFDHDWYAWGLASEAVRGPFAGPPPSKPELALVATLFTVFLVLVARRRRRAPPPLGP